MKRKETVIRFFSIYIISKRFSKEIILLIMKAYCFFGVKQYLNKKIEKT